jgi:anti-sigma-K factor RskA
MQDLRSLQYINALLTLSARFMIRSLLQSNLHSLFNEVRGLREQSKSEWRVAVLAVAFVIAIVAYLTARAVSPRLLV